MLAKARQICDGLVLFQNLRHGPALLVVLVFVLLLHAYASCFWSCTLMLHALHSYGVSSNFPLFKLLF